MFKLGLVKNKTEAYLMYINTLIIISVIFMNFHQSFLLGSSFCGAWADFLWNCERSFKINLIFYLIKEFMKHSCLNFFYEIVNKISIKVKRN